MSFSSDLKKASSNIEKRAEKIIRGTSFAIFKRVIERTPVKTGRAKGNWQTDIGQPASGDVERNDTTPKGSISQEMISSLTFVTQQAAVGDAVYMVNNLPYIQKLEDGSSQQAPAGMVKVTRNEFVTEVNRQARKLK